MTHVLIIEDEPAIADTLIYACQEAGIQTTHHLLGHEALADLQKNSAQKNSFDCVLLDVGLPDMTGFDVCKQIRIFSNIPILFLTARNHEIDRIVGLEIGADDYVTKPFSPREVVARIKAILRRGAIQLKAQTQHNQAFLVDDVANRIQYRNQFLVLTRYEFLLLKTLIKQPNRVFSRDQLMDLVWVNAEETLERTVDAHIKTLRAKLREIDAASETIVTHRGMGYSLLA
jgi:two-component system, OmpR family, catabolic regulation response regulator CreB